MPAQAKDNPRFDFSANLRAIESRERSLIERMIFELPEEEFKQYRREHIEGYKSGSRPWYGAKDNAHVTALFNVTDDVPESFEYLKHEQSIIASKLELLISRLSDEDKKHARIKMIGKPDFSYNHSSGEYYEQVDLFIDKPFLAPILDHPQFIDITHAGTQTGVAFYGSKVRFSPPRRTIIYTPSLLRRGFYKEIAEALVHQPSVNVHVQLNDEKGTSSAVLPFVDQVIEQLGPENYQLIKRTSNEFLISLNKNSAEILYRDPRVKIMKDYDYHLDLELARGRWQPTPLSIVSEASSEDIFQIMFESRTNLFDQPSVVIESLDQLNQFFDSIGSGNSRSDFIRVLKKRRVNFSEDNLVLYSQTEPSGSIDLTARPPTWVDGELTIIVDRYSPGVHTTDIAQHLFAFSVDKKISHMRFRSRKMESMIKNEVSGLEETKEVTDQRRREFENYKSN